MKVEHTQCAGLDVHKKVVVAAIIIENEKGEIYKEVQYFGADL